MKDNYNASVKVKIIKWFLTHSLFSIICKPYRWCCQKSYYYKGRLRSMYYQTVINDCGSYLIINGKPKIYDYDKIHIGNHVTINDGAQISPRGEVYIGNYVTMSRGSQITAGQLDLDKWMEEKDGYHSHIERPVYVADGCWLCINSIVLPGVSIRGKGVVVAAGAVVSHDIDEDYVVVGGVPAKILRHLDD